MNKNIPAFPRPHSGSTQFAQEGMSLLDYFAAYAMQALIANSLYSTEGAVFWDEIAEASYEMAEIMLKVRNT